MVNNKINKAIQLRVLFSPKFEEKVHELLKSTCKPNINCMMLQMDGGSKHQTFEICFDRHYLECLSTYPTRYPSGMLQPERKKL